MENVAHETEKAITGAIKIDEKEIQDHIDGLARQFFEDTVNALLKVEAGDVCNTGCHPRTPVRRIPVHLSLSEIFRAVISRLKLPAESRQ